MRNDIENIGGNIVKSLTTPFNHIPTSFTDTFSS